MYFLNQHNAKIHWNDGKNISQIENSESSLSVISVILLIAATYGTAEKLFQRFPEIPIFYSSTLRSVQRISTAVLPDRQSELVKNH
jgi:hypothetical protein